MRVGIAISQTFGKEMKAKCDQSCSSGLGYCLMASALVFAVAIVGLKFPLRFTLQISEDALIRGMMSAFVFFPLVAIALYLALRQSRGAFVASVLVPSFFSALWVHLLLFGNKLPELAYQEPLLPRITTVLVYLTSVVALPAMLAMLPFVFRFRSEFEARNRNAEQVEDCDASQRPC